MGNQLSAPPRFQPEHLQELDKVVYKQSLGESRHGTTSGKVTVTRLTLVHRRGRQIAENCAMHSRCCWPGGGEGKPEANSNPVPAAQDLCKLAVTVCCVQVFYKRGEAVDLAAYQHVLSDIRYGLDVRVTDRLGASS